MAVRRNDVADLAGISPADSGRRPNVVFVLVDDQGYGDLGCHGHPRLQTPALDRLWGESVRLTDFHVSPMCTPTRGSLLTGLDPLRHGAMNVSSGRALLRQGVPTLAEAMRAGEYRTGIFGKWHLGDTYPYRPQDRGFEKARWFPSSHITSTPDRWENDYFNTWLRTDGGDVKQFDGYCTDILFDQALQWIDSQVTDDEPFFAFIPLNAAHIPLLVPDKYREPYADLASPHVNTRIAFDGDLATYFGMIANIDENMAKLDTELRRLGIWDDTIVIYMSDNGADPEHVEFYNAGMRGHKTELWEGGHRVPFFIRWPRAGIGGPGAGRDVDELTTAQDFMPTMMELCGLNTSEMTCDGVSLAGLLHGEADAPTFADRQVVIQYSRMPIPGQAPTPTKGDAAVLWGKWRLIGHEQLYHIGADPAQTTDIAQEHPDVVAHMQSYYDDWWRGVDEIANTFSKLVVGSEKENPVLLSPSDWRDTFLDQTKQIRAGLPRNGTWGIEVAEAGRYRIELRRWPVESGLAMRAPAPEFEGGDCLFPAGKSLKIRRARLRVGDQEVSSTVEESDRAIQFDMDLEAGSTTVQTWFEDDDGHELCGAYYVYVERLRHPAAPSH